MTCQSCRFWNDWDTIKDGWTECMATGATPEGPGPLMRTAEDPADYVQTHYTFSCSLYQALNSTGNAPALGTRPDTNPAIERLP